MKHGMKKGAAIAVFRFKAGMIPVLFACAGLGAAYVLLR